MPPDPTPSSATAAEHPDQTATAKQDTAVRDTFPASDPVATTMSQGPRAVPVEAIMPDATCDPAPDATPLRRRFADATTARLALEALVREGPIDRRHAVLTEADGDCLLVVTTGAAEHDRLEALLDRLAG